MKPCDCRSMQEAKDYLEEQGLAFNNWSFRIAPNVVYIERLHSTSTIRIPMCVFECFAEWYLTDQEKKHG